MGGKAHRAAQDRGEEQTMAKRQKQPQAVLVPKAGRAKVSPAVIERAVKTVKARRQQREREQTEQAATDGKK
jgi:hypothetical protein